MADSVYTPDMFGPPSREPLPVLASDKAHSRNYDGAGLPAPFAGRAPLLPLAELAIAHDFAI